MTTPSVDAASTVRRLLDAYLAGDADTFLSYVDDHLEWNPAEHHPFLTRPYRGRQEFIDIPVALVTELLDGFRFDIQHVLGCGDVAVSQLRYQGTVKSTGRIFDVQAVIVWDVRDGKVVRTQEYMDTLAFTQAYQSGS